MAAETQNQRRILTAQSAQFLAMGDDVGRLADQRRALFKEYWDRFEKVDARMKGSLDRNWKIFGRVIARESLMSLSRELDEIRRHSARLSPGGGFDAQTLQQLGEAQEKFAKSLEGHARNLGRSQGAEWLTELQADFATTQTLRTQLAQADSEFANAFTHMEDIGTQMARTVRELRSLGAWPREQARSWPRPARRASRSK